MKNTLTRGLCALASLACVAAQAMTLSITNISMVGGNPQLVIQCDIGVTNEIQCKTNLSQANWVVLTNLVVAQSPYAFVDMSTPVTSSRFYRVVGMANTASTPTGMALIPAGSFTMGNCMDRAEGDSDELPLHTVYVSAFYMDKNLVAKALWDEVYQWAIAHGYGFDNAGSGKAANHPVQTVSWYDVVKWCNARSEKEGRVPAYYTDTGLNVRYRTGQVAPYVNWNSGYRLPTEAEWEKAARGGLSGKRFPWGDTITQNQANYGSYWIVGGKPGYSYPGYSYDLNPTAGYHPSYNDGVYPYTSPVGSFAANGYGLYDMAGNIFEWCWDLHGSYSSGSQTDPRGPSSGSIRVVRGGDWDYFARFCRTADRYEIWPDYGSYSFGFRSALPSGQ